MIKNIGRSDLPRHNQCESDIFIDNLPVFPDDISSNGKDTFWLALIPGLESRKDMDSILPQPFIRKIFMCLPE